MTTPNVPLLNAADYAGANPAAQINNAVAALGANPGIVIVPSNLGAGAPAAPPATAIIVDMRTGGGITWTGANMVLNPIAGFVGNILDLQIAGTSQFKVDQAGNVTTPAGSVFDSGYFRARAAIQMIPGAIYNAAPFGGGGPHVFASSGTTVFTIDAFGHLISTATGAAPATSNLGANVTSATFTGNDVRGTIAIVMSGALAANTRVCTATFANSYGATPPKITLVDQTSAVGLTIVNSYVLSQSTGVSFDIAFDQALAAGTYTLDYIVIG